MKIIMKGFAEIFGKVALMVMVATALFAGSIFLSTSVASACCDIPCPSCCPPPECSDDEYNAPEPITIFATKIVCNDESYLPNWGATQTPINGNTVSDFLNGNGQYCSVDPDWQFQWASQNTGNPGDNTGVAVVDWTTFLSSTQIDFSVVENLAHIWVREVWNNLYIPFTGATTTADESAEMYCHTDTINYDNYDCVDGIQAGGIYYCVGFNALIPAENVPPVADAGDDQTVTVGTPVNFDGSNSTDADGTIVSYEWNFDDGNTGVGTTTTHTYSATGTYSIVLTVTDDDSATSTDMVEITVIPENAPVCPNVVVVSNTDDIVDGISNAIAAWDGHLDWTAIINAATWIWKTNFVEFPKSEETYTFTKDFEIIGTPATTTLNVAADNNYTAQINGTGVASDQSGNNFTEADIYTNLGYLLHAGINTIMFEVTNLAQTGGTAQSNPAGLLYRLEIEIEGDSCLMENTGPEILGADTPLIFYVGDIDLEISARAGVTANDAEDGDLTSEINVDVSGIDTSNVGTTSITYTVDDYGYPAGINILSDTVVREVQVVAVDVNKPPTAVLKVDPSTVYVGDLVAFDGTASYDTDGIIVSYDWGFGDMATSTGATTTHTYTATGIYSVILTVTDDDNATGTDAVQITVEAGNNPVNPGDVIINELMWMGSATSTADEWIELKNASSSPISLKDCYLTKFASATTTEKMLDIPDVQIAVGGFYLISNWNEIKSNINVEPNLVDTSVNLSNNNLKIELYCGETLIDTAGDGGVPLAGNNGVPKKSMQKCGDSWEDALVGGVDNNWDANATELGTPGLANVCEDENTPPTILGADDPLVFYVGDIETELELEALARLGVTATDTQDVILAGDIEITGLGSVSTSTVGTTTISYDVDDYGNPALSAQTVIREVRTVTQCSDGIDNDDDTMIDANDPGCWTDTSDPESYDPQDNDESYDGPEYPQCADELDNDGDGLIDYPNDPGCSSVDDDDEYNAPAPYCGDLTCSGSETCSTCSQDCGACSTGGGGGGGGWLLFPTTITITNEDVDYLGNGVAMVTWNTDISATSQVVYGDNSINKSDLGSAPKYGYDSVNEESLTLKTSHSMLITGLTHGTQYYFRPVSDKSGVAEVVGKEVTYTFVQVPPVCTYLLEYIKLGSANNPVEVKKLEQFLNDFEGENLAVNGIYEQADYEAVKRFQTKYREDILDPWNHTEATGYVYLTTKKKINELYCQREFPLTVSQEAEVATFKALLGGLQGSAVGTLEDTGALDVGSLVGAVDDGSDGGLADASSGTTAGDETEGPGLLASILGVLGFGDDEEGDATDSVSEEGPRNLASVIYSGVIDLATSFWFILLLIVTAIVLFFRIRGAERRE